MQIKYAAKFEWGKANLARIGIVKETTKTYSVAPDYEPLLGYMYFPSVTKIGTYQLFGTLPDANAWLIAQAKAYAAKLDAEAAKAHEYTTQLHVVLDSLSRNNS
jgi:hypothetical protein